MRLYFLENKITHVPDFILLISFILWTSQGILHAKSSILGTQCSLCSVLTNPTLKKQIPVCLLSGQALVKRKLHGNETRIKKYQCRALLNRSAGTNLLSCPATFPWSELLLPESLQCAKGGGGVRTRESPQGPSMSSEASPAVWVSSSVRAPKARRNFCGVHCSSYKCVFFMTGPQLPFTVTTVCKQWHCFLFVYFFRRAKVCWPLICWCRPICIFERCLDSNPESCRRKQARYQLSQPSPKWQCSAGTDKCVDRNNENLYYLFTVSLKYVAATTEKFLI